MGVIYNPAVSETLLHIAEGFAVYGKVNRYEFVSLGEESEKCYISIRITGEDGKNIINLNMGNNVILEKTFNLAINDFLYWLRVEKPGRAEIEAKVYEVLCQYDCLFCWKMRNQKLREQREQKERERIAKQEKQEAKQREQLAEYCEKHGYFIYYRYGEVIIVEGLTDRVRELMRSADNQKWIAIIDFVKKYPSNDEIKLIFSGNLEEAAEL